MSAYKQEAKNAGILAPLPETERGRGIQVYLSPDGSKMAYGNANTVVIRDVADPTKSTLFYEHKARVNVVAWNHNGNYIASGDANGVVIIWEVSLLKTKIQVAVCKNVLDLAWGDDGKKIVACGDGSNCYARVFTWDSGNNVGEIIGFSKPVLACAFKASRPFRLALASEDLSVNMYEGPPFKLSKKTTTHSRYPNCVRFSPSGDHFVSVGSDSKIYVYETKTGEMSKEIVASDKKDNHSGSIYTVCWSSDGKQLFTVSGDKTCKTWDVESGACTRTFTFSKKPQPEHMQVGGAWSPLGLISVSLSGCINYLDSDAPDAPRRVVQGHQAQITGLALHRASGRFFTSDIAGQLCAWEHKTGEAKWFEGKGHGARICALGVSADGELVYTAGLDDRIRANKVASGQFADEGGELKGTPAVLAVSHKDAGLCVVGLEQNALVVVRGGQVASRLSLSYLPLTLCFSLDGAKVYVGGKDNFLHVYTLDKDALAECKEEAIKHYKPLSKIAFKNDGTIIVTADQSRNINLWKAGDNSELNLDKWQYHNANITALDFNPAGDRLLTASNDESLLVWSDFATYKPTRLTVQGAHVGGVAHAAFWDDNTILSVGFDRSVKIWTL